MGLRRQSTVGAAGRRSAQLAELRRAVFESSGRSDPATRAAAGSGGSLPEPLGTYVAKVRDQSYRVTDRDITALATAGLSEDEIFELTVAAALGAACRGLDAGIRALRGEA
jgi:hypothetical protein